MKIAVLSLALCASLNSFAQSHLTWADYGGSPDAAQFSALKQINKENVTRLKVAWSYPIEDANHYPFSPLIVDGVMYVLAHNNAVVALDASTGKEIWRHTADPDTKVITNRGINYWESKDRSDRRLLFAANHMLQAIDARTGKDHRVIRQIRSRQFEGRLGSRSADYRACSIRQPRSSL